MAEVVLDRISKRFGAKLAVADYRSMIEDGSFVVLLGPTGAGKTTTLRLVAGLEKPDDGRISIAGRDVTKLPPAQRDVAFVFQQYSLYPHLSVFDNLAFPLRSPTRRVPESEISVKVNETAALLRIASKLDNRAAKLSGGEMQRVAIGRALVRRPEIYLMDEPLSSLDAKLRADLRLELKRIHVELGATFLYVTHDQIEAMTMATKVGVIEAGRLAQIGTPREIYENPNSAYVAARLGQPAINLMPRGTAPEPARPGARGHDRGTNRAPEDRQIRTGRRARACQLDRAFGRPVPSSRYDRWTRGRDACRSGRWTDRRGRGRDQPSQAIVLRLTRGASRRMNEPMARAGGRDAAELRGTVTGREAELTRRLVGAIARVVVEHTEELTALDAAIGDGDHGHNMKRGFEAVLQDLDTLSVMSLPDLLKAVGMKLLTKVGGASGPLYGTLFLALSKELPAEPTRAQAAAAFEAAIAAVRARGKSGPGQKTMLDVLVPSQRAFADGRDAALVKKTALAAAEATAPMRATRGRASFLGERSIGHVDPGARSASLMIAALCDEYGAG